VQVSDASSVGAAHRNITDIAMMDPMRVIHIDHVQLAMPAGQEQIAREFYAGTLGIPEVPKPAELAKRGGAWFESGAVKIHLGVEADFRPARKAHPALVVEDLNTLVATLRSQGHEVVPADGVPGRLRVHVFDPFGNRIELMEPAP
jgi:catechol 2,3-dioxygenase-like lactoylglutathione lyase family enzyme